MTTAQARFSAGVKYTDATGLEVSISQPSAETGVEVKVSPTMKPAGGWNTGLVLGLIAGAILGVAILILCVNSELFSWKASGSFGLCRAARFSHDSRPLAAAIISLLLSVVAIFWILCWRNIRLAKIEQEDRKINCDILKFTVEKEINKRLLLQIPIVQVHSQVAEVNTANCNIVNTSKQQHR
jgi:hypothetical protein